MAHNILGLDIGSHTVKVVEMGGGKGGLQLLNFATMPTPPDAIQQGVISDPQTLGQSIKQLLAGNGIRTKQVVSSVAGQTSLVVRIIEVPPSTPSELQDMVPVEIERYTPFADTGPIYSWEVIERPGTDPETPHNVEILFAAAQEDMIQAHVETLQAAGLQPQAIDVEPLAISRPFVNVPGGPNGAGETIAFIDLGALGTEISIVKDGVLHFPRSIPVGGEALTRAIADGMGVNESQAERLKREHGTVLRELSPEYAPEGFPGEEATPPTFSLEGVASDEATDQNLDFSLSDTAAEEETGGPDFSFSLGEDEEESETLAAPLDLSAGTGEEAPPSAPEEEAPFTFSLEDTEGIQREETAPPEGEAGDSGFTFDLSEDETEGGITFVEEGSAPTFDLSDESTEAGDRSTEEGGAPVFDLLAGEEESTGTAFDLTGAGELEESDTETPLESGESREGEDEAGAEEQQIYRCLEPVLNELATEIRRSLEYYRNRHEGADIDRIILVGGTARLRNLDQFLQSELGVRVEYGDPLAHLIVTNESLSNELLFNNAPLLAISVGLAMHQLVS